MSTQRFVHKRLQQHGFLIFPNWKQPRCPPKGEWTKNYDIFTYWYLWDIIMNNRLIHTRTWMYLKSIILHEEARDNRICLVSPFIRSIKRGRTLLKIKVTMPSASLQDGFQTFNPQMELSGSKYILNLYIDHVYVPVVIPFWEEILWFHYRNWQNVMWLKKDVRKLVTTMNGLYFCFWGTELLPAVLWF